MAKNGFAMSNRVVVETITTASKTLTKDDCGKQFLLSKADGIAVTLPASPAEVGSGWNVKFLVKTSVTSNIYQIVAGTLTDLFVGGLFVISSVATKSDQFAPDGSGDNSIEMNGTTKGGLVGTFITVVSDGTNWHVHGTLAGSGTPATPFNTES